MKQHLLTLLKLIKNSMTIILSYFSPNYIRNPHRIILINPKMITQAINLEITSLSKMREQKVFGVLIRKIGKIESGNWDNHPISFDSLPQYKALHQFFVEKMDWDQTAYYDYYHQRLKYIKAYQNTTWESFKSTRLNDIEKIYLSIKNHGYHVLNEKHNHHRHNQFEVEVAVNSHGQTIFVDGRHRLIIAKLLGIQEIPVIVNVWHGQFIEKVLLQHPTLKLTPANLSSFLHSFSNDNIG
jgi:hypothetical protein